MEHENLAGILIWAICLFGCAFLFFGIGIWAQRSKKPVHFWSGTTVALETVRDIPAYNHANAVMWKWYSAPYFLSGVLGCLDFLYPWCMPVAVILLMLSCVPGCFVLVWAYMRIQKTYILP